MSADRILIVLTSHDALGSTGEKTGFWLEELASPYYVLKDAGARITLASPKGGQPPVDPKSNAPEWQTEATRRFEDDPEAKAVLARSKPLSDLDAGDYDAIFFPGGHGPMWDYPGNKALAHLIEAFDKEGKPIGAVCHGPAALVSAKRSDGAPLVRGRKVTGFTNGEEAAVELTGVVPFLLEDKLKELGGEYVKGPDFESFVVADGHIVTGQNPASSVSAAEKLLEVLDATRVARSA
jgi:putative intracellular protease/amidase